jgi:hypothetical protein
MEENIFGGYTLVEWESKYCVKKDETLKSFLFTLKNPRNILTRKFVLKAEKKDWAISCYSELGPSFGYFPGCYCDICISEYCNANSASCTSLGNSYTNETGLANSVVLTGPRDFRVQEIEVFEITI